MRTERHVHVYSVFGRWCYVCGCKKRWWRLWETWAWEDEEHDEPF